MKSMGYNKAAFAQMKVENMSQEDVKQFILLGLAEDNLEHQEILSQLESKATAKSIWDWFKKAGTWIKETAHKVVNSVSGVLSPILGKIGLTQQTSRAYVTDLAQKSGVTNLPKLSLAEL